MKLTYGAGHTDVLVDISSKEVIRYKDNPSRVHELYGGKQYYVSRSGLSGAGTIPDNALLIKANTLCRMHGVAVHNKLRRRIYVQSHIITNTIAAYGVEEDSDRLDIWKLENEDSLRLWIEGDWNGQSKCWEDVLFFNREGETFNRSVTVYHNSDARLGFPFQLFMKDFNEFFPKLDLSRETPIHSFTRIGRVGHYWMQFDKFNIPIARWDCDPILTGSPEVTGWTLLRKEKTGAFFVNNKEDKREKLLVVGVVEDDAVGKIDYEMEIDRFDLAKVENIITSMREGIEKKRVTLLAAKRHNERKERILSEIESGAHDSTVLTFAEACEAGFCKPGIDRFIAKYGLKVENEETTIGELRQNPKYAEIKTRQEFQTLATLKIVKQTVG